MKKLIFTALLVSSFEFQVSVHAADVELHGFVDGRYGLRTQNDPNADQETINELRLQLDALWYHDLFTAQVRSDFLYDGVANNSDHLDLETGEGPIDLREAYILFSPTMWMDVKAGRQILTWGTGDLLFINDLFPKDWKSFFSGRDEEYLKAPSDALFVSLFPSFANIDIAYSPRFDSDRYIDGERFSYWGGAGLTGSTLQTDKPDSWFEDDEIAMRIYRNVGGYELALYGYDGFWKTPQGYDTGSGKYTFPKLSVYGASARGSLLGGIGHVETGYYDSREDRDGTAPNLSNNEARFLVGYERELASDLTGGVQYYIEHMMHHDRYLDSYNGTAGAERDQDRHVITLRLTQMLMNQNLTLGLFTYWSPSDHDAYLRPKASYKVTDNWLVELSGNFFFGRNDYTFFGQFEDSSNIALAARYSF
ncbi:MAG: hypothetical protein AB7E95_09080 [Kiritimatiellales bacterium]